MSQADETAEVIKDVIALLRDTLHRGADPTTTVAWAADMLEAELARLGVKGV